MGIIERFSLFRWWFDGSAEGFLGLVRRELLELTIGYRLVRYPPPPVFFYLIATVEVR